MAPGAPALDAPLGDRSGQAWLLDRLGGSFVAVYYLDGQRPPPEDLIEGLKSEPVAVEPIVVCAAGASAAGLPADVPVFIDTEGLFAQRYDALPGSLYLFRPDQHLTARWRHLDLNAVRSAVSRSACLREAA
jgi:3-(3-hydroxy-phenyl)propionate hydroxylase